MKTLTPALCALTILGILLSTVPAAGSWAASFPAPGGSLPPGYADWVSAPALDDGIPAPGHRIAAWQAPIGELYESDPELQELVDRASGASGATGISLPAQIVTRVGPPIDGRLTVPVRAPAGPSAVLELQPQGVLEACLILFPPDWKELYGIDVRTVTSNMFLTDAPDLFYVIAREVYRCHQYHVLDDVARLANVPLWIADGTANFVALLYTGGYVATSIGPLSYLIWTAYFDTLGQDLLTRTYDAAGFFAHLYFQVVRHATDDQDIQEFWEVLDYIIHLPWPSGDNPAMLEEVNNSAFDAAVVLGGEDFLASWAMGTVRVQDWGDAWWLHTPGLGDEVGPPRPEVYVLVPGEPVAVQVGPRAIAHAWIQVQSGAPMASVLHIELTGYGGIYWPVEDRDDVFTGPRNTLNEQSFDYCVDPAGCACPDGSTPLGDDARSLVPGGTSAMIALTGGPVAGSARFTLQPLAELCSAGEALTEEPVTEEPPMTNESSTEAPAGDDGEDADEPTGTPADVPDECSTSPSDVDTGQVAVVTDDVNLRSGPGVVCDVIETVPAGSEVEILSEEVTDGVGIVWTYVRVTGTRSEGWISADFLGAPAQETPPGPDGGESEGPDLAIASVYLDPAQPVQGEGFLWAVIGANLGTTNTGDFHMQVLIVDIDRGATYPDPGETHSGLNPGDSYQVYEFLTTMTCPGPHEIRVTFSVPEGDLDPSNNQVVQSFTVLPNPDLSNSDCS